jgi:hypothetical protein
MWELNWWLLLLKREINNFKNLELKLTKSWRLKLTGYLGRIIFKVQSFKALDFNILFKILKCTCILALLMKIKFNKSLATLKIKFLKFTTFSIVQKTHGTLKLSNKKSIIKDPLWLFSKQLKEKYVEDIQVKIGSFGQS